MVKQEDIYQQAVNLIQKAKNVLIVAHRRPDGDTLGACSAFYFALTQLGKNCLLACVDEIPLRLKFIPETDKYVNRFDLNEFDLIIINDAGAYHMAGFHEKYPDFLSKRVPIINIDHHASNEGFGTINIVDGHASSTTMIVWKLLKQMSVQINSETAFCLLTGIYSDTGSFVHANTTKETFEAAAEISRYGVSTTDIAKALFKESTLTQLRLWGYILENMRKNDKQVFSCVVTESDLETIGAHASDTGGIIDLMNTVPDAAFTILLAEDSGLVKGSLRTQRDDVDVAEIAGQFGGGGHKKASGFRVHGRLEKQTLWKIVSAETGKTTP